MRQIFAVVPPMSNDSALASPKRWATRLAKMAPPAGPDSTNRMGNRAAVSMSVKPPPEVIIRNGHPKPRAARSAANWRR